MIQAGNRRIFEPDVSRTFVLHGKKGRAGFFFFFSDLLIAMKKSPQSSVCFQVDINIKLSNN